MKILMYNPPIKYPTFFKSNMDLKKHWHQHRFTLSWCPSPWSVVHGWSVKDLCQLCPGILESAVPYWAIRVLSGCRFFKITFYGKCNPIPQHQSTTPIFAFSRAILKLFDSFSAWIKSIIKMADHNLGIITKLLLKLTGCFFVLFFS